MSVVGLKAGISLKLLPVLLAQQRALLAYTTPKDLNADAQ
jgi:hypothetical protein